MTFRSGQRPQSAVTDRVLCGRTLSVHRPRIFFLIPSAIFSIFFFAPFIASLSSFGRCLFPQFLTRLLYCSFTPYSRESEKDNFFPLTKWDIFLDLNCLSDLFSAGRDKAVKSVGVLHSDKSGNFSPMTRGGVTAGTFLKLMI